MLSPVVVLSTTPTQAPTGLEANPINPPLPNGALSPEKMKSLYREDVRAEFLHLQAEADCLLQQLQSLQQAKRQAQGALSATIAQTVSLC